MFQKSRALIVMAVVATAVSGCATNHAVEGALAGAIVGGTSSAAATGGDLIWTTVGTFGGALIGGFAGGQVPKDRGIAEANMAIQAKQFALLQECRRDEWNRTEQAVRWAQTHGGKPEQYYVPDYVRCDRMFVQPQVRSNQAPSSIYTLQPNIQRQ